MSKNKLLSLAVVLPVGISLLSAPAVANAAESVPESFTYNGAGWGHGVGMSQYGAYGMALEGNSAEEILEHYYNPAELTSTTKSASSDILVQLISGQSTTTIKPANGQLRVKFDGKTITSSGAVKFDVSGSSVKINVNGTNYTTSGTTGVTLEWQNTRYWDSGTQDTTVSVPYADGGYGTGNYRHGKITVKLLKNKLNIVNSIRLNDEYLFGLAEVPSSWPSATLQAQAIAGRTYAQSNMGSVKASCECNVYDEVDSQKFTGWNKENEANGYIGAKWVAAVNATQTKKSGVPTSAKVMTYKGSLINAVYSSSTGGKTRTAKSVWGYDHAYLQSRDDRWALKAETGNPNRAWSNTITQAKAKSGYGLSDVKKIAIKRDLDQTIISSTAMSSNGKTATLTGAQTRTLFGAKSRWVFGITAKGESLPATDDYSVTSTPANVRYAATSNLNMRSGPSTAYASLKVVANGSEVTTTGKQSGTWLQIKSGTSTGWVSSAYLKKITVAPTPPTVTPKPPVVPPKPVPKPPAEVAKTTTYVATANVNLRTQESSNSVSRGVLAKGKGVEVYSINKGWAKVKHGSGFAYVSSSYIVKKNSSATKPPVVKDPVVSTTKYKATTNVNVRTQASTSSALKGLLAKNKTIDVYSISKGWAKVKYSNITAYVSSSYLVKVGSATKPPVIDKVNQKKTTDNLNMRAGASTGHKIIKTIPKNSTVSLTGKKSGSWLQVTHSGQTGWVSSSYVK